MSGNGKPDRERGTIPPVLQMVASRRGGENCGIRRCRNLLTLLCNRAPFRVGAALTGLESVAGDRVPRAAL